MEENPRPLWKLLLQINSTKKVAHLTCEECFALLEYDAGILADGAILEEIRPSVLHHLSLCRECRTNFKDWLKKLEQETGP